MIIFPIQLINAYWQVLKHLMSICSLVESAKANDLESRSYLMISPRRNTLPRQVPVFGTTGNIYTPEAPGIRKLLEE